MIDRQHGNVIVACDSCDETFTLDTDDFDTTWSAAKREGWRAEKVGTLWLHACADCEIK
jgi:hypothetical protein